MSYTSERAKHAALCRRRPANDPDVIEARRDLKAARAVDYARELVDGWPPLSPEQRMRVAAALLYPGTGEAS